MTTPPRTVEQVDALDALSDITSRIHFIRHALASGPELPPEALAGLTGILDDILDDLETLQDV